MPLGQLSCVMAVSFYVCSSLPIPAHYFYFAYLPSKIEEIFLELVTLVNTSDEFIAWFLYFILSVSSCLIHESIMSHVS